MSPHISLMHASCTHAPFPTLEAPHSPNDADGGGTVPWNSIGWESGGVHRNQLSVRPTNFKGC